MKNFYIAKTNIKTGEKMETRSLRKSLIIAFVLLCLASILAFVGCGDIYKNIKITSQTTEIELWLNSDNEEKPSSQVVPVTVSGIGDKNVSKELVVVFEGNRNIATTSTPVVNENGEATFEVTARASGEAIMFVKLKDNTKVSSEGIKIKVTEPVKKIAVSNTNLMVEKGKSLNLVTSGKITFSPVTTTENEVDFSFAVSGQLAGITEDKTRGLVIEDGVLKANSDATAGLVTIVAKSTSLDHFDENSPLQTSFQVLVCDDINEDGIFVKDLSDLSDDGVLEELTLVQNSSDYCKKVMAVGVKNTNGQEVDEFVSYSITKSKETSVSSLGVVDVAHNYSDGELIDDQFVMTAQKSGSTTFNIEISIVDENGNVYKTISKPFLIKVKSITESIEITVGKGSEDEIKTFDISSAEEQSLKINVFDQQSYVGQNPGTWMKIATSQSNDSTLKLTVDKIRVLIDDKLVEYGTESAEFETYKNAITVFDANKKQIAFDTIFETNTNVFVAYNKNALGNGISLAGFDLKVWANNNDERFLFSALVSCSGSISYGQLEFAGDSFSENESLAKVGQTLDFEVSSKIANVDLSLFDVILSKQNIVSVGQISENHFSLIAVGVGEVTVALQEKYSLTRSEFVVCVVVPTENVWVSAEFQDGIAEIENSEDSVSESISDKPLKKLVVGVQNKSLEIFAQIKTSTENATIKSVECNATIEAGVVSFAGADTPLITFKLNQTDGVDVFEINITFYKTNENGIVAKEVFKQEITIEAYIPISVFAWDSQGTQDKTFDIYDNEELSLANQQTENVGFVKLKPYLFSKSSRNYDWMPTETESNNLKIQKVVSGRSVWNQSFGQDYEILVKNENSEDDIFSVVLKDDGLYVSAKIGKAPEGQSETSPRASIKISIYVNEFGKLLEISATINFFAPTNKVDLLKYSNDQIYLEAYDEGKSGNYGEAKLDVFVGSNNAFDKGLTYVVYDASDTVSYIFDSVLGELYKTENNPILVALDGGDVVARVNQTQKEFDQNYFIKVLPSEVLNEKYNKDSNEVWKSKFESSVAKVLTVTLHNGQNKDSAYKIFDGDDFLNITNNFGKYFELQNDITLENEFTSIVLSDDNQKGFSGALFSAGNGRFRINNFVASQGFFAEQLVGSISNVEFVYANLEITTNKFGLITANNSQGAITGVKVTPEENAEITINVENSNEDVVIGGLVADNLNAVSDVFGTMNLNVKVADFGTSNFYVGGIAGKLIQGGSINFRDEFSFVSNLNLTSNTTPKNSAIGGIVGYVNQGKIVGVTVEVEKGKKIQGLLNAETTINAPKFDNVGGVVGVFENPNSITKQIFVVPNIVANNNVGGAFGVVKDFPASGVNLERIFVEFYGDGKTTTGIRANNNVGGFVGNASEDVVITHSYVLSYVNLVVCKDGSQLDEKTQFYGDIVAVNNVGGFVGTSKNSTFENCFARLKIGVNTTENSPNVGGFVGSLNFGETTQTRWIKSCFAVDEIFVFNNSADSTKIKQNLGEFFGSASVIRSSDWIVSSYVVVGSGEGIMVNPYADENGKIVSSIPVQNFGGTSNFDVCGNGFGFESFYAVLDSGDSSLEEKAFGAKAKKVDDLKIKNKKIPEELGWGETDGWFNSYSDDLSINDDFPVLTVTNEVTGLLEYLYGSQMTNIQIESEGRGEVPTKNGLTAGLPTFWTYSASRIVVSMDSLALTDYKTFVLSENLISDGNAKGLVSIKTSGSDKKVNVTSSNPGVVSISNLATFELQFKSVGYSTITITSRKNPSIQASFEICVVGGFVSFDMYYYSNDTSNQSIDIENKIIEVAKQVSSSEFEVGNAEVESQSDVTGNYLDEIVQEKFSRNAKQGDVVFVTDKLTGAIFKYVYDESWSFNVITKLTTTSKTITEGDLSTQIAVVSGRQPKIGDIVVASVLDGEGVVDVVYNFTYTQSGWQNSKLLKISKGGAVLLYTSFTTASSKQYDDSFALFYDFSGEDIEVLDAEKDKTTGKIVSYLKSPFQTIIAKGEVGEKDRIVATLAIKVQFKNLEDYVALDTTSQNLEKELVQKAFKPYIFEGVSKLSLSENVGEIENSETFELSLTVETDATTQVLQNIDKYLNNSENPMKIWFSSDESNIYALESFNLKGEDVFTKNGDETIFKTAKGIMTFKNPTGHSVDVEYVCTPSEGKIVFNLKFSYWKTRISEPVVEYVKFVATNDDGSTKTANVEIHWQPTTITTLEVLHYSDKADFSLTYGKEQSSTKIGSGKLGLLKVSIIQPYADFDYITVSSDENNAYPISFAHYLENNSSDGTSGLVFSDEYSRTNLDTGTITINNNQSVIFDSVFYVSTLTEVGIPEGTYLKINVVAYKNDGTIAGKQSLTLSSVFAPYVQMSLADQSFGNFVARGTEVKISATGVAENSTIKFSLEGISSDTLKTAVLKSDTNSNLTFEGQNGNVELGFNLYVGILAEATNGELVIVGRVYSNSGLLITESRLTLFVVDFLIESIGVEGLVDGKLDSKIQEGYTALKISATTAFGTFSSSKTNQTRNQAAKLFQTYFPSDYSDYIGDFYEAFGNLSDKIYEKLNELNATGAGTSGDSIWRYGDKQININNTYANFYVASDAGSEGSLACVAVRGKVQVLDDKFGVSVARGYMLSNDGFYESRLGIFWETGVLSDSLYSYSKSFSINFSNSSTETNPDPITTADELAGMVAGGHYILMNDIYLSNWKPLTTKIGSLDGNGHILTIQNFNLTTTTETGGKVSSINVGLFETLSTFTNSLTGLEEPSRLLNIILEVSRTVVTDLRGIASVNFGFLVGHNQGGVIYNCDVLSAYRETAENEWSESTSEPAENQIINNEFANNNYTQANWVNYIQSSPNITEFLNNTNGVLKNSYSYANDIFHSWYAEYATNYEAKIYTQNVVSTFVFVSPTVDGTTVDANVGGLVGLNDTNSYITNSRVGRVGEIKNEKQINDTNYGTLTTQVGLNIFGGGRLGGVVGQNNGTIASSYFANGNLVNMFNTTNDNSMTGGFAGLNGDSGNINTSYVLSAKPEISLTKSNGADGYKYCKFVIGQKTYALKYLGTELEQQADILDDSNNAVVVTAFKKEFKSGNTTVKRFAFSLDNVEYQFVDLDTENPKLKYTRATQHKIYSTGPTAGFVNQNQGEVENCFCNIEIVSSLGVGGFVYSNLGTESVVENCYSASLLNSSSNMNGQFVGVDATLNVLNDGSVENCFYLVDEGFGEKSIKESLVDPATALSKEALHGGENSKLWGFVFQNKNTSDSIESNKGDGVWLSSDDEFTLPNLVQANLVSMSIRKISSSNSDGSTNYTYHQNFQKGSIANPRIVFSTATFNETFSSSTINDSGKIVRFVADVDFLGDSPESSYKNNFAGKLWGNGMNIKNYRIVDGTNDYLGLFSVIGDDSNNASSGGYATVSNLVLTPNEVLGTQRFAVGALAGRIGLADVNNIKIYAYDTDSNITGYNATGGLAGIVNANDASLRVENIKSSIKVVSTFSPSKSENLAFFNSTGNAKEVKNQNTKISYAGGVIGVVDYDSTVSESEEQNASVSNLRTFGNVVVGGEIVGGVIGFVGKNSIVSGANFVLNQKSEEGQSLQGSSFSGGIVGENRGLLQYSWVALSDRIQQQSDEALVLTGNANDQLVSETLFEQSQFVVGGIVGLNVGHTQTGKMAKTGRIIYSYNRGNVVSTKAVVAGGLVGLSVPSLAKIDTKDELNNVVSFTSLSSPLFSYEYVDISEEDEESNFVLRDKKDEDDESTADTLCVSLYANNVYSTGKVSAKITTGGLVGIAGGIVDTPSSESNVISIPSSFESSTTDATDQVFEGALFGKMLYSAEYVENEGEEDEKVKYILCSDGFKPAESTIVSFDGKALFENLKQILVGNLTQSLDDETQTFENLIYEACFGEVNVDTPFYSFFDVAIHLETLNAVFNGLSASEWKFDTTRSGGIFPQLVTGKAINTQTINNIEDFFAYIKGGEAGNFVVATDLTFDLSDADCQSKLRAISTPDNPISGSMRGEKSDGSGVTITVQNNTAGIAFLGYIKNLTITNIDFVFDSTVNAIQNDCDFFGLVAYTSQSCRFTNVSVSAQNGKMITLNSNGYVGVGGIVGKSQSDYFTQTYVNLKIVPKSLNDDNKTLQIGGLVGCADHLTISKTEVIFGCDVKADFSTKVEASICVGAYCGDASGYVSINSLTTSAGTVSSTGSVTISLNPTKASASLWLGGVIGHANCSSVSSKIQNLTLKSFDYTVSSAGKNFVGGIVGEAKNVGILNCETQEFNLKTSTSNNNETFVGGIAGKSAVLVGANTNGELQSLGALLTCFANVQISVDNAESSDKQTNFDNKLYVGGLVGEFEATQTANSSGNASYYEIFGSSYATGNVTIKGKQNSLAPGNLAPQNELFAGGMIGKFSVTKSSTQETVDDLSDANFSFGQSANDVNIVVTEQHNLVCLGGIVGYSNSAISNCFNYGLISNKDQQNNTDWTATSFVGGIAGKTTSTIYSAHSFGAVFGATNIFPRNVNDVPTTFNFVGAIVGKSLAKQAINSAEYCVDFVGVLQENYITTTLQKLSYDDLFKEQRGTIVYGTENDAKLPYLASLEDWINQKNTNISLTKITSQNEFETALKDETNPNKTILFASSLKSINLRVSISISNASKIVGQGVIFNVKTASVFDEIPANVLVSGIIVTSSSGTLEVQSGSFGALANTNNGIVVNCVAGMLPSTIMAGGTIAENSKGLSTSKFENLTAELNIKASGDAIVGSLVGTNNNIVLGCWSYSDITNESTGSVGGLVGENFGAVSYSYTMGRLLNTSNAAYKVGGVIGFNGQYKLAKQLACFVDISSISYNQGIANFNSDDEVNNPLLVSNNIVVSDLSSQGANTETKGATKYDYAKRKTIVGSSESQLDSNFFGVDTGSSSTDLNLNYGLPFLNLGTSSLKNNKNGILQDVRFTGDGLNTPYEIENFTTLKRIQDSNSKKSYALTRDIKAHTQVVSSNSSFNLDGNYKTIFIDDFSSLKGSNNNYTLFNLSLADGKIERLKLKLTETATISFGGSVIAPLVREIKDKATIENCAVFGNIEICSGSGNVGGLVGNFNGGTINQCWTDVQFSFNGITNSGYSVGGIAGSLGVSGNSEKTSLTQSFASGPIFVTESSNMSVGGLVGYVNFSTGKQLETSKIEVKNCYFSGQTHHQSGVSTLSFDKKSSGYLGAFAGKLGGTSQSNCYQLLTANNKKTNVFDIESCYFAGVLSHYENTTTTDDNKKEHTVETSGLFGFIWDSAYLQESKQWTFSNFTYKDKMFDNVFVMREGKISQAATDNSLYYKIKNNPTFTSETGENLNSLKNGFSTTVFDYNSDAKPYLKNTTPRDRNGDEFNP